MTQDGKEQLIIIDSNAVIHRAFHALPPLTDKKGEMVNAIYGFLLVLFKAIKEFQPEFIAACFDLPAPTFRHKKFKEYKAKRPPAPKELYMQIPKVKEVLAAFNIPVFEKEGYEADDLIGTIAKLAPRQQVLPELEAVILTGDMDTLQLVDDKTKVYALSRGVKEAIIYDSDKIRERFSGLNPDQMLDFKALKGDPSDNIPGVQGIGEKTAIKIIKEIGSLESFYQNPESKSLFQEKLLSYKDQILFARNLNQIKKDVPIDFRLEDCRFSKFDKNEAIKILEKFEFYSLIKRLPELQNKTSSQQNLL
ncbi:MAG: hypothetical protein HYW70_00540 [Candidatus Nealsonbacteria bacterium]|nr:hypothetical protein [Candidatus Nealsonbacteria bacterium]